MIELVSSPGLIADGFTPLLIDFPFERNYVESIIYVSLYVSLTAVLISTLVSLPLRYL